MHQSKLAPLAFLLASGASAFTVSLWNGPQCTSGGEGSVTIDLNSGCQTLGAGVAESATITPSSCKSRLQYLAYR